MYKLTILPNKLKIITSPISSSHGITTGLFVSTGSRYENEQNAGVSHFLEHMFFKGTKKRPTPADIAKSIEGIGGYTNAATSQDYTFYYNKVPTRHFKQALDVLADMINNSLFDSEALEREKGVVLEELNMFLDTPSRYVYDLVMNLTWGDHPLGRDIIGTPKSIANFKRDHLVNYINTNYQPQNMVVSIAGKINHTQAVNKIEKYFGNLKNKKPVLFKKVKITQSKPRVLLHYKKTDQVHLCLAMPSIKYNSKDETALALLDTILGSGMSSRLFLNIRERQGLCYSIQSFTEKFKETGLFGIIAGLNTDKIDLAIKAIIEELKKLTSIKVASEELKNAKEYLRGNLSLQMDNTDNVAVWYGNQALFYPKIEIPEQKIKKLLQITENDIIKLARKIFQPQRFNLALIGPFKKKDQSKFLKLLKN